VSSRLFTIEEAAARLNVSPRWVRRAVFERRFGVVHLGRLVRVPEDELERYVQANRAPARRFAISEAVRPPKEKPGR
jgi:excisionase family DNA binding protein